MSSFFILPDVVYEVQGSKAKTYLHGQLTNHILNLKDGEASYNLLLNLKGKIQADLYVYQHKGKVYLSVTPELEEVVLVHLKKLAVLSKVEFLKKEEWQIVHIFAGENHLQEQGQFYIPNSRLNTKGYDCFFLKQDLTDIESGMSVAEWETLRVQQGVPKMNVDFSSENLPQEASLERALHFDKGCYLGQEIVARLQYRGHVNRKLQSFQSDVVFDLEDKTLYDDAKQSVGQVTSFVQSENKTFFLGYVSYKALQEKKPLYCDNHLLTLNV